MESQSSPSTPPSAVMAGIGLMLVGIFFFALNDALGKWLIATYSVGQLLLVRSIAGLVLLAPFIKRTGWAAFSGAPRPFVQFLRPVFATFEVACFYWALAYMPLADVMTFYLAGPIYVTAISPFILGERIGWRRWLAVFAGFAGVMIALNPSAHSLTPASLVALAGSFAFSLLMICTRLVRGTSDIVLVTTQTVGALAFGAVAAPLTWVALSWGDTALLVLLGATAMVAHVCINRSLKLAPASVVVPYQYTTIIWAILLGYIFFGDIPAPAMLTGAAIIIAAGIYIFVREARAAKVVAFADPP
ncbi:MAG: DMT family transporter [Pseudolabrys sp.]|nr:DMT family transporter [Pseudolabrys sp.]MSP46092.1 DMT family transporter [Xanthobacteraceae bacterium]